jgi:hypothetical protein
MFEKDSARKGSGFSSQKPNALITFFTHPLVGSLGSISGIIGVALAIYFYVASKREPHLTYYVHPIRAPLVQTGKMSDFSVLFRGALLPGDVTAAQIAIWNAGSAPIKGEDILSPILIQTEDKAPILEVSVRKISRPVTGIGVDNETMKSGRVVVHWRILEQDDGCVLQVIYLGSPSVKLSLSGDIVGQKHLEERKYSGSITTPEQQYGRSQNVWIINSVKVVCWLFLPFGVYMLVKCIQFFFPRPSSEPLLIKFAVIVMVLGLNAVAIWLILYSLPEPPFGF